MRVLILGGTIFLGRHVANVALQRGHTVTLFTRGRHNPELFPQAEHLVGDRDGGLAPLKPCRWDAVIDTSGYVPRVVGASAALFRNTHYTFVSTVSAYADFTHTNIDENAPTATLRDPTVETVDNDTYGPLKALCEQAVLHENRVGSFIVRPGLIVGPFDPSDRFTYWPRRAHRGGDAIAPGDPAVPVQFIDVRDLAEWIVRGVERQYIGVFNAVGPERPITMRGLLEICAQESGNNVRFVWLPDDFLIGQNVEPWTDLPMWLPRSFNMPGMEAVNTQRAREAGLRFRLVRDTMRDTAAWDASRPQGTRGGLSADREAAVLTAWRALA